MLDLLDNDILSEVLLQLGCGCDIAAVARTDRRLAEGVRHLLPVVFPNAAGSQNVIDTLAGGNQMELRRLQARMAGLCLVAPQVTIEVTSLVLLVQFQQMTYDGSVTGVYAKWVQLADQNFSDGHLHVDLSPDNIPVNRSDWPLEKETKIVLKLVLHRSDTQCAAVLYDSSRRTTYHEEDDILYFEEGLLPDEVGSMLHLQGEERQARVLVHTALKWRAPEADNPHMYPFDEMSVLFMYYGPDTDNDEMPVWIDYGRGTAHTDDTMVMFTHRLRWIPM